MLGGDLVGVRGAWGAGLLVEKLHVSAAASARAVLLDACRSRPVPLSKRSKGGALRGVTRPRRVEAREMEPHDSRLASPTPVSNALRRWPGQPCVRRSASARWPRVGCVRRVL